MSRSGQNAFRRLNVVSAGIRRTAISPHTPGMTDHVYKSVEVTGSSQEGVTEAIQRAIAKASETLRHLDWFEVVAIRGQIGDDGSVAYFQVTLKIGFRLED
jgi:dodecin